MLEQGVGDPGDLADDALHHPRNLPRDFVTSNVELAYATTTPRAQGRTVGTALVLIDDTTTREALYVSSTRGRRSTHLYVQNGQLLGLDAERPPAPGISAKDILVATLERETSERTATEIQREAQTRQPANLLTVAEPSPRGQLKRGQPGARPATSDQCDRWPLPPRTQRLRSSLVRPPRTAPVP